MSEWSVEDVKAWLLPNHKLSRFADSFATNEVDGYTLLTLTDEDMLLSLRVSQAQDRQQLQKAIKKLVILWIQFGKNAEEFFKTQVDSIFFDESAVMQRSLMDSFSLADLVNRSGESFLAGSNDSVDQQAFESALNESSQGQQLMKRAKHIGTLLEQDEVEIVGQTCKMDPVEEMYHKTLSSFRFMIRFGELMFDRAKPLAASDTQLTDLDQSMTDSTRSGPFMTAFMQSLEDHQKDQP